MLAEIKISKGVKLRNHLLAGLVLTLLPAPLLACFCDVPPPFCSGALPDTGKANHVVFVGKVTEVYPNSYADMREEFARTHRDLMESLRAQSMDNSGRQRPGSPFSSAFVELRKQIIEYVWGDTLTPAEREQLRTADWRDLDSLAFEHRQRVRLEVVESFAGADAGEFTLYTYVQGCGFDFAEGQTYLVEAYKKVATGTWEASSCSRTRLLAQATEDLEALHAWKTGQRLPGRISGRIIELAAVLGPGPAVWLPPSGTPFRIRLLGGKEILETTSGGRGEFRFENLDPALYEVELVQAAAVRGAADLTRASCATVNLSIRR